MEKGNGDRMEFHEEDYKHFSTKNANQNIVVLPRRKQRLYNVLPMKMDLDNATLEEELIELRQVLADKERLIDELFSVIDSLPTSIYWKDRDGIYHGRNKASAESLRRLGYQYQWRSIVGKTDFDLFDTEMARQFTDNDWRVLQTGIETQQEEETIQPDGRALVQLSIKRPWRNKRGEIIGIIGNTFDITHLKEIEAELREAKEQAEVADRLKTQFIRDMEHDIRTPLAGIIGLSDILASEVDNPKWQEFLHDIHQCGQELMEYSDRILEFAKMESNEYQLNHRPFSIQEILEKLLRLEKPAAEVKHLRLSVKIDENTPSTLIGDDDRLYGILLNLISNAIKFTPEGSVAVTITPRRRDPKKIWLEILVEDSGLGIPEEQSELIFDKFFRSYASNNGRFKGIGLGLYLVKKFVEQMGGQILVSSQVNHGTKFTLQLPFEVASE